MNQAVRDDNRTDVWLRSAPSRLDWALQLGRCALCLLNCPDAPPVPMMLQSASALIRDVTVKVCQPVWNEGIQKTRLKPGAALTDPVGLSSGARAVRIRKMS